MAGGGWRFAPTAGFLQTAKCIRWGAVALRTRAWIETTKRTRGSVISFVALRTRAWIETGAVANSTRRSRSPSARGRGSKRPRRSFGRGALPSPSARGRGSKPDGGRGEGDGRLSPSVRGRGSKQPNLIYRRQAGAVALRTRAWIETSASVTTYVPAARRPPYEGVDRNGNRASIGRPTPSSPSVRGRGSKRLEVHGIRGLSPGRPPYEGVDRNRKWLGTARPNGRPSPSVRGRGSKRLNQRSVGVVGRGRPPYEGVDRNDAWLDGSGGKELSPSVRGRGSKHGRRSGCGAQALVALRTRAWIETRWRRADVSSPARRPPYEGVDRNPRSSMSVAPACPSPSVRGRGSKRKQAPHAANCASRPPCEGVDRNTVMAVRRRLATGRPPHEGVDRNQLEIRSANTPTIVAARACARIETHLAANANSWTTSRPPPIRAPTSAAARPSVPAPWCRHSCGRRGRSWTSPS